MAEVNFMKVEGFLDKKVKGTNWTRNQTFAM